MRNLLCLDLSVILRNNDQCLENINRATNLINFIR